MKGKAQRPVSVSFDILGNDVETLAWSMNLTRIFYRVS